MRAAIARWTKPKSRRARRCQSCAVTIEAGERYRRFDGLIEGEGFHRWYECLSCAEWRTVFEALGAEMFWDFEGRDLFEIAGEYSAEEWTEKATEKRR